MLVLQTTFALKPDTLLSSGLIFQLLHDIFELHQLLFQAVPLQLCFDSLNVRLPPVFLDHCLPELFSFSSCPAGQVYVLRCLLFEGI